MLEHDYARAIVALQEEGADDAKIASGLARVLTARGHERLVPRIDRALTSLRVRSDKRNARVLRVSTNADAEKHKKEIADAIASLGDGAQKYETVVDERIVGGFILASGTMMFDASYRTALITLYRTITAEQ